MPNLPAFALLFVLFCCSLGCGPSEAERLLEERRSQPLDVSTPPSVSSAKKRYRVERRVTLEGAQKSTVVVTSEAAVEISAHVENGAFRVRCTYEKFRGPTSDAAAALLVPYNSIAELPLIVRFDRHGRVEKIENLHEIKKEVLQRIEAATWPQNYEDMARQWRKLINSIVTRDGYFMTEFAKELELLFFLQGRTYHFRQPIEEQRRQELGSFAWLFTGAHLKVTDHFLLSDFRAPPYADAVIDARQLIDGTPLREGVSDEERLRKPIDESQGMGLRYEHTMKFDLDPKTRWPTRLEITTESRMQEEMRRDQSIMTLQSRP
ncbi:MAG: hypothetical protein C0483_25680 [Pirellula sp.]|nr:hypothetical protein [Pirellula sp.]